MEIKKKPFSKEDKQALAALISRDIEKLKGIMKFISNRNPIDESAFSNEAGDKNQRIRELMNIVKDLSDRFNRIAEKYPGMEVKARVGGLVNVGTVNIAFVLRFSAGKEEFSGKVLAVNVDVDGQAASIMERGVAISVHEDKEELLSAIDRLLSEKIADFAEKAAYTAIFAILAKKHTATIIDARHNDIHIDGFHLPKDLLKVEDASLTNFSFLGEKFYGSLGDAVGEAVSAFEKKYGLDKKAEPVFVRRYLQDFLRERVASQPES